MFNTLAWLNPEVALIALVAVLVLVGGKKIPELMRGIGQGVGELKRGMEDNKQQLMSAIQEQPKAVEATSSVAQTPVGVTTSTTDHQ